MDDILKRLEERDIAAWNDAYSCRAQGAEAAARIRELEAENAALREARHLPYCPHRKHMQPDDCVWCITERTALEPAPVTPAQAAKVLLDAWRNSQTIDADEKAQDYADIHECDVDAGRILEPWLRALADAGEAG